ncbi:MAG: hypothetical protein M1812_007391 [Candelaria pacifica]|nr:MAG: hypothetical protein M1812_007391 [Candelaria pacifica]
MPNVRSLAQQNHAFNATRSEQDYVAAQQQPVHPSEGSIGVPSTVSTSTRGPPGDWQADFWDCFSPTNICCMAYWCPCVLYGRIRYRLDGSSLQNYQPVNRNCISWYALALCNLQWAFQMSNRQEVRTRFNINGSAKGDCLRSYFCGCCELMQEEKEVLLRTQGLDSTGPSNGYKRQEGMVFAAQQ